MSESFAAIVARLKEPTRGTYRVSDWLTGPHMAQLRAQTMSALCGSKMPQSKSGITALVKALYSRAGIVGNCSAASDKAFSLYCAKLLGDTAWLERHEREEREYAARYGAEMAEVEQSFADDARKIVARIPLCSPAGMARQLGVSLERGAALLAQVKGGAQ